LARLNNILDGRFAAIDRQNVPLLDAHMMGMKKQKFHNRNLPQFGANYLGHPSGL
jgi:hypothetical protein